LTQGLDLGVGWYPPTNRTRNRFSESLMASNRHVIQASHIFSSFRISRAARSRSATSRRLAIASAVTRPCLWAFWLPFGASVDGPPCIRHRPFFIAGDWHGFPLRVEEHPGGRVYRAGSRYGNHKLHSPLIE
jgi:hypothetical protein